MKSINQTMTVDKKTGQATKTTNLKGGKLSPRRSASPAKRPSRASKRSPLHKQTTFAGYSDSASRLIARGKTAFGDAYAWAGEAGSALPRTVRDLGLPDQKSLKAMIDDKPLIIGAVGLGIGVALGSMLPLARPIGNGKRVPARPTRRK